MASFVWYVFALSSMSAISVADTADIGVTEDLLEDTYGKIIFSSVLFRHGHRTPKLSYPNDPHPASIWIEGFAQLTKRGKQQAYDLGKWLRERYASLVPDAGYRYDLLTMSSSNLDRTIMSGELGLAGMFPPGENEIWARDGLRWQPIPVYTIPLIQDNIISIMNAPCPRRKVMQKSVTSSTKYLNFRKKYESVIEYTLQHAGFDGRTNDFSATFDDFEGVCDTLNVEASLNMTLPAWTKAIYPEPSVSIISEYYSIVNYNAEYLRLTGGPFLKSVVSDMQQKRDNLTKKSFHFYSGHDTTITIVLSTLRVYNSIAVPLSSSVLFELRKKQNEHTVVVLYRNTTEAPPYVMQIPGCKNVCTLDNFIEATKELIPDNWDAECQLEFDQYLLGTFGIVDTIEFVVIVGLFVFMILAICVLCIMKKRRQSGYQMI